MDKLGKLLALLLISAMITGCSAGQSTVPTETAPMPLPKETTVPEEILPETAEAPLSTQPERQVYDTIPRYYQTDYPHDKFSDGTISTSGCSMTCLAMVATYLTDWEYTPDEMAYHFDGYGKDNIDRLEYGNAQMQLPNVRTDDVRDVLQALEEGKVVIAMMDQDSVFTTTQHFIVLAGITGDGKILVNDPLEKKHPDNVYMQDGYQNGFPSFAISGGISGAWIYDKAAMPEDPFLFDAEKPAQPESRYSGYHLTPEDRDLLARFLWVEAREEPEDVQQAVVEVFLNRLVSEQYPDTVHSVIFRSEFYEQAKKMVYAQPEDPLDQAVTRAMYGPYILPEDIYLFSAWETAGNIWGKLGSYNFLYSR